MDNIHLDTKHQVFWLTYDYLLGKDVSQGALNSWSTRNVVKRKYLNGRAFINYDTIPEPTREKLPSKEGLKIELQRQNSAYYEKILTFALNDVYNSVKRQYWAREITENKRFNKLNQEQISYFSKRAAVIERAVELQSERNDKGFFNGLFYAYKSIYPNDYSMKNRFSMALKKARENGILSVAIDKRTLRTREPKFKELHTSFAFNILSDPRAFKMPMAYEMLVEYCEDLKIETPSITWLRDYYRKNKNFIDIERYGKEVYEKEQKPYAKIIPALNRNTQWQIDGWEIPIYGKRQRADGSWETYFKFILFAVLDAHSRKYVGFSIGESENTDLILKGLENAVKNTGVVPGEIVSDNHAFNKTKEAEYFKAELAKLGVIWTVDSNPRRKAILERSFRTLSECHLKKCYGYLGAGVRAKGKGARVPQELIDEYTKNLSRFPGFDNIATDVIASIIEYNAKLKPKLKHSPNEKYESSTDKFGKPVDVFKRMQLFTRKSEQSIANGQFTIKRGMYEYEYQLPAEFSTQYNGQTVCIRYADFQQVYLYDIETDEPICSVKQKQEIRGAVKDQVETDTRNLFKNSGRLKGINGKAGKLKGSEIEKAVTINPNAAESMNKLKVPKETVKQLEQDYNLREAALGQGVKPEKVTEIPVMGKLIIEYSQHIEDRHPFEPKHETKIEKVTIEDLRKKSLLQLKQETTPPASQKALKTVLKTI